MTQCCMIEYGIAKPVPCPAALARSNGLAGRACPPAIAMHRNVPWLRRHFVPVFIEEFRHVPLAHWQLVAAEARKRLSRAGFSPEEIAYVEEEIRHEMDLSSDR